MGIKIIFATARSAQTVSRFTDRFSPDVLIAYDGALAVAGDTVIHRFAIPAETSLRLTGECLRTPEISQIHAINETAALTSTKAGAPDTSHYMYYDFTKPNGLSYLKITVTASGPEAVEAIASGYPECSLLRYTGEDMYRFASRDASKRNAVAAAAKYCGLSTDSSIAFGDDINDLEMIQNCGIGVAMANAAESVKAVADYVCGSNNNDGAAKWLEEYLSLPKGVRQ
jgi:Cof subfamily protein (haloacid dehalogenase superfamily)